MGGKSSKSSQPKSQPLLKPSNIINNSGCNLHNVSSGMTENVFNQVIKTQDSVMSQYDILLRQLNDARRFNNILSNTNNSLWKKNYEYQKENRKLSNNLQEKTEQVIADEVEIKNLQNLIEILNTQINNLKDTITGLVRDKEYLLKKNILDKTIQVTNENKVLLNQIIKNKENYSTDFQKIFYKEQQLMKMKSVNFYLLLVYYFFIIILIYYAFFNKNNLTLYFKISWIVFFSILPLLSFIFIDITIQTFKFLRTYVFSFMYGHSFYSNN